MLLVSCGSSTPSASIADDLASGSTPGSFCKLRPEADSILQAVAQGEQQWRLILGSVRTLQHSVKTSVEEETAYGGKRSIESSSESLKRLESSLLDAKASYPRSAKVKHALDSARLFFIQALVNSSCP
jgi:hypothetical protein